MADFHLQSNEAVLLKAERVMQGAVRFGASYTDDLLLTNVHLIWVNKGTFGGVKKVEYFPIGHIKVFNDEAQALLANSKNGRPSLEIYFQAGQESFQFFAQTNAGAKKEVLKWIAAINGAVTGEPSPVPLPSNTGLPGSGALAKSLGATFSHFKDAFASGESGQVSPQRVATKCLACGAQMSGISGTVAKCSYCDSATTLP
jgi:hypothetical protein